jgi:hypothetical protein
MRTQAKAIRGMKKERRKKVEDRREEKETFLTVVAMLSIALLRVLHVLSHLSL